MFIHISVIFKWIGIPKPHLRSFRFVVVFWPKQHAFFKNVLLGKHLLMLCNICQYEVLCTYLPYGTAYLPTAKCSKHMANTYKYVYIYIIYTFTCSSPQLPCPSPPGGRVLYPYWSPRPKLSYWPRGAQKVQPGHCTHCTYCSTYCAYCTYVRTYVGTRYKVLSA